MKFKSCRRVLIGLALALGAVAIPVMGASNKVASAIEPVSASAVKNIGGYIGQRISANREVYLKQFDIGRYVRMVEEKKQKDWWWIGEQPGKWLESAVLASGQAEDKVMEESARKILARLQTAQEAGGYLGITSPEVRTAAQPVRGMDPYELYFMLHGLLTAAEEWHDAKTLQTAKGLGDYFESHIGPGKAEFWPSPVRPPENLNTIICPQYTWVPEGTRKSSKLYGHSEIAGHTAHYGWEGTLLIDPMLRLYQATGEKRYLEWGKWITENLDKWSGWNAFSKLDQVADGKLGVHQLQPYVHSHTFQMNFLGFLRLYEITGDATLMKKVTGAWKDVAGRQLYITGGVSVGEHYEPGYRRPVSGHVVETCANMSWLELTQRMLDLSGDAQYAETIERLLFNHVFASQTIDGDCYRYHTPPNGFKPDDYFHGPDCCTSSGHRLVAKLPGCFYGQGAKGLYIHQFVPSSVRFNLAGGQSLGIHQETTYPETSKIVLHLESSAAVETPLNIRIPAWCATPSVSINDAPVEHPTPGQYLCLKRTWKTGDRITLNFPMQARWIEQDHFEGDSAPYALIRGPVVYALDTVWWNDKQNPMPFDAGLETGLIRDSTLEELPAGDRAMGPFYSVEIQLATGGKTRATLVPFSNIGRWYRHGEPKPEAHGRAYSYAVWLQDASSKGFKTLQQTHAREAAIRTNSVDYVMIGNAKSESQHALAGNSTTGPFNERTYRHAGSGGSFSWNLKVSTEQPTTLIVTYWGGENNKRVFDVTADGVKLATTTLLNNKPGQFFEERYAIPFDLIQGKTDALGQKLDHVTIKFQGHPGSTAGGVFGIRTTTKP